MIAYKGLQPDQIGSVDHLVDEATPQLTRESDDRLAEGSTIMLPPVRSNEDAPLISVVEPRALGRETLARALEGAGSRYRSRAFARLDEWLTNGLRHETSVILLSIGATDADDPGLAEDLQLLVREYAHIPMIVMGDIEEPSHVVTILGHGARGYIPTSVSLSVAVEAISLARAGGVFVPASSLVQSQYTLSTAPHAAASVTQLLTERQAAVADAVARGKANKIIAYELNLCESTVKVHIRSIMKKLQARNRTEVAFKLHSLAPRKARPVQTWSSAIGA
ncbi:response regulator transcription factor [Mycobacterium sp. KBS0706]|uniref:LuxR C-terminal-related transcriptional regulator n=1 Tax=Mycobacterium sp. KBS0706 TaxID=2578109 RepID=UPI00110FBD3F|nr:response regulator transcription factor [Mycobacterium sp. KBS0706]TSD82852.1 response regulator transcription factor [Mycobacterium sp. KBS0706]